MSSAEHAVKIDRAIMPGMQGGPLMNTIAAKAVAFNEALQPSFAIYQKQIIVNAQAMADEFMSLQYRIVAGGTDNHLFIVDLRSKNITGLKAEIALEKAGITVTRSCIPFDTEKPWITSGIRIGTPAITTRKMHEATAREIVHLIDDVINHHDNETILNAIKVKVRNMCAAFPIKFFLLLFLICVSSIFAMQKPIKPVKKSEKGVLLTRNELAWELFFECMSPVCLSHKTVCFIAQTCKQHEKYILDLAKKRRNVVFKSIFPLDIRCNIQRTWHKYGSACYDAYHDTYSNALTFLYFSLKDNGVVNIKITTFDTNTNLISDNTKPFFTKDGLYCLHAIRLSKKAIISGGDPVKNIIRCGMDGSKLNCYITDQIKAINFVKDSDALKIIFASPSSIKKVSTGEKVKSYLEYNCCQNDLKKMSSPNFK